MILYRRKQLPAYLAELPIVRVGTAAIGAVEEDFAFIRPYTDGELCVSELDAPDAMTLAWQIPSSEELAKSVERCRSRPNATISYTTYGWYWSDIVRFLRGIGSANYKQVVDCPDLSRAKIRALAANLSIIDFLHYAAEAAQEPSLRPTKSEEAKIKQEEKRLFALQKLTAKQRKLPPAGKVTRVPREFSVSSSIKNRVLANHKSCCFFSGISSLKAELHIHHIIPCRVIELLRLSRSLFTAEFNLVPMCADLNLAKSANLSPEDVALCLERFAAPSHPNHGLVKYLRLIQQMQSLDPNPLDAR